MNFVTVSLRNSQQWRTASLWLPCPLQTSGDNDDDGDGDGDDDDDNLRSCLQISDTPSEPEPRGSEAEGAPHLDAAAVPESVEVKARSVEAGGGGRVTSLARERGVRGPGLGVPIPGVSQEGVPPRSSLE